APGPSGAAWVGTDFGGLLLRKPGNEELQKRGEDQELTPQKGLPSATVTALAAVAKSQNELVWAGTSAGLCLVRSDDRGPHVERSVRWKDGLPSGPVDALAAAPDGGAYIAYNILPRNRVSDEAVFERRTRTRLFRVPPQGPPQEIRTDDAFTKSEVRA